MIVVSTDLLDAIEMTKRLSGLSNETFFLEFLLLAFLPCVHEKLEAHSDVEFHVESLSTLLLERESTARGEILFCLPDYDN